MIATLENLLLALQTAVLGYFVWQLQTLVRDLRKLTRQVDQLQTEHNMYKDMSGCPLMILAQKEKGNG